MAWLVVLEILKLVHFSSINENAIQRMNRIDKISQNTSWEFVKSRKEQLQMWLNENL